MLGMLLSILSGALMSIQGVFNTGVTKQSSIWVASGFVQFSALLVCVAAWFFTGRQQVSGLFSVSPWYMLTGGVIGAFITCTVIWGMNQLGPARSVMLIVVSQLLVAYLIEVFGLFGVEKVPFEWHRILGMGLAIAGIIIFKW